MTEELCEKIVKIRRKSDRVMTMVLVFEEQIMRVMCAYGPQLGRSDCEKDQFYNDMAGEWDLKNSGEMVLGLRYFNGHVGKRIDSFVAVHGVCGVGDIKDESNTRFQKKERRKITGSMGEMKLRLIWWWLVKATKVYVDLPNI